MDNGFVGELTLRGEKKDQPYFFELRGKNPARDDQLYEGAFGRYGMFRLDLGWDRTPHVLSNSAQTIFQESGSNFTLPSTLRGTISTNTSAGAGGCPAGVTSWNCPVEYGSSTPAIGTTQKNFIRDTITGLLRPVDLGFNTDVGHIDLKFTPTDALRFDLGYSNLRREGHRPIGTVIGSPGGAVTELAIPVDNMTQEVKFGAEFARPDYALQFNYTGSFFRNEYDSYTWDNPGFFETDSATNLARVSRGQISAPPDNLAHTFSLTGSAALPLRSRISGTFAYSLLRQDETFLNNTVNGAFTPTSATARLTNADDAGNTSPDAKADLLLTNIQFTSRPINNVTVTARYRFFEYMNDTPFHVFSFAVPEGASPSVHSTAQERYTKQNAGLDLDWRPIQAIALKAGYEYEHWVRGDRNSHSTAENIAKFSADITPIDWFLGRVTYSYGDRYVNDYEPFAPGTPALIKFDQADRRRNRVDLLMQFSAWETVTPSASFGFAQDDYYHSAYGLTRDDYYTAGVSLGWSPLSWLQFSADYTYERYDYKISSESANNPINDWQSKNKDDFHTVGVNAVVDLIPKKFDVTLGYAVTFGYTTIRGNNVDSRFTPPILTPTSASTAQAFDWDKIQNILQTFRVVGRYRLTEKLQVRGGFAYERYNERDFARDPMRPFMGDFEMVTPTGPIPNTGIQWVWLGATKPNYEAYIFSGFVRYQF